MPNKRSKKEKNKEQGKEGGKVSLPFDMPKIVGKM